MHLRDVSCPCLVFGVCVCVSLAQFEENLSWLYPLIVQLMRCSNSDVRRALATLFTERISSRLVSH
jgi:hypothetical protein